MINEIWVLFDTFWRLVKTGGGGGQIHVLICKTVEFFLKFCELFVQEIKGIFRFKMEALVNLTLV